MSNLGDHGARLAGIIACGERLVGIGDVEQMMWNVCPLLGRGLGRTNLEMTVDRNRIATDDLTGELLRQADSEGRLAGSRGSENDEQKRLGAYGIIYRFAGIAMQTREGRLFGTT